MDTTERANGSYDVWEVYALPKTKGEPSQPTATFWSIGEANNFGAALNSTTNMVRGVEKRQIQLFDGQAYYDVKEDPIPVDLIGNKASDVALGLLEGLIEAHPATAQCHQISLEMARLAMRGLIDRSRLAHTAS
jgi:hypothetical protein